MAMELASTSILARPGEAIRSLWGDPPTRRFGKANSVRTNERGNDSRRPEVRICAESRVDLRNRGQQPMHRRCRRGPRPSPRNSRAAETLASLDRRFAEGDPLKGTNALSWSKKDKRMTTRCHGRAYRKNARPDTHRSRARRIRLRLCDRRCYFRAPRDPQRLPT